MCVFKNNIKMHLNKLIINYVIRNANHNNNNNIITPLIVRSFHITSTNLGKRNFRKFPIPNQRGQWEHPKLPKEFMEKEYDYPIVRDTLHVRWPGVWFRRNFVYVPEMEPELIVPDLEGFNLKPYVSHRTPDIQQNKFTARDLFNATYADQIIEQFKNDKEMIISPNDEDIENAKIKAQQTGADLFMGNTDHGIQS